MRSINDRKGIRTAFLSPAALALILFAQTSAADDFVNISDIKECRAIEGKVERLLCYDTIADGGIYNEEKLQEAQEEDFGSKAGPTDISLEKLTVTIVKVSKAAGRIHYFYTDDGKVWKQSTPRGNWIIDVPFEAEIRSGMMGSFFLVLENGKSTRVKRVQ